MSYQLLLRHIRKIIASTQELKATLPPRKLELDDLFARHHLFTAFQAEEFDFSIMSRTGCKHNTSLQERSALHVLDSKNK